VTPRGSAVSVNAANPRQSAMGSDLDFPMSQLRNSLSGDWRIEI
jgi:hypothetical protein